MTEQILRLVQRPASVQHVRGERMSQLVRPGQRTRSRPAVPRRATRSLTASSRIGAPTGPGTSSRTRSRPMPRPGRSCARTRRCRTPAPSGNPAAPPAGGGTWRSAPFGLSSRRTTCRCAREIPHPSARESASRWTSLRRSPSTSPRRSPARTISSTISRSRAEQHAPQHGDHILVTGPVHPRFRFVQPVPGPHPPARPAFFRPHRHRKVPVVSDLIQNLDQVPGSGALGDRVHDHAPDRGQHRVDPPR